MVAISESETDEFTGVRVRVGLDSDIIDLVTVTVTYAVYTAIAVAGIA